MIHLNAIEWLTIAATPLLADRLDFSKMAVCRYVVYGFLLPLAIASIYFEGHFRGFLSLNFKNDNWYAGALLSWAAQIGIAALGAKLLNTAAQKRKPNTLTEALQD